MIDYEDLGGVVVVTHTGQKTVSQLLVKRAEPSDSGKYTCQPSNGEAAFVMLHVLYGEWLAGCVPQEFQVHTVFKGHEKD